MRFRIGKLLHWFLDGFDPVGCLVREDLSTVLRGTRGKEKLVGRLDRAERNHIKYKIANAKDEIARLEEQLLQDEVENPNGRSFIAPVEKPEFLVLKQWFVQANGPEEAVQQVYHLAPDSLGIHRVPLGETLKVTVDHIK